MSKPKFKRVIKNGKEMWLFRCPVCKKWGCISNEQKEKQVLIMCECGNYQKTVCFREGDKKI